MGVYLNQLSCLNNVFTELVNNNVDITPNSTAHRPALGRGTAYAKGNSRQMQVIRIPLLTDI